MTTKTQDPKATIRDLKEKLRVAESRVRTLEKDPDFLQQHEIQRALGHLTMNLSSIPADLASIKGQRHKICSEDLEMVERYIQSTEAAFADYRSTSTGSEVTIINI